MINFCCEDSDIIFMGASATHMHKLDSAQRMAERLCNVTFPSLASYRNASSIGLLCKLLYLRYRGTPSTVLLYPYFSYSRTFLPPCHRWYFGTTQLTKYKSLDLFINSFLGTISSIWNTIPLTLRERGVIEGWSTLLFITKTYYWQSMLRIVCIVCRNHTCLCVHCIWYCKKNNVKYMNGLSKWLFY